MLVIYNLGSAKLFNRPQNTLTVLELESTFYDYTVNREHLTSIFDNRLVALESFGSQASHINSNFDSSRKTNTQT
jgi:hypothetical protein